MLSFLFGIPVSQATGSVLKEILFLRMSSTPSCVLHLWLRSCSFWFSLHALIFVSQIWKSKTLGSCVIHQHCLHLACCCLPSTFLFYVVCVCKFWNKILESLLTESPVTPIWTQAFEGMCYSYQSFLSRLVLTTIRTNWSSTEVCYDVTSRLSASPVCSSLDRPYAQTGRSEPPLQGVNLI